MKTEMTPETAAGGMDQRFISEASTATHILNMRVDDESIGWVRDRGWEPYNPAAGFSRFLSLDANPIYSLAVHTRNRGAEVYAIYEQDGALLYEHGIAVSGFTSEKQYLDSGRRVPAPDDPGTQYVEHGRDLIIINGTDQALRFRGDKRVRAFGFNRRPSPPIIAPPDPNYYESVAKHRNQSGSIALRLNKPRGLGSKGTPLQDQERYLYRIAWESETGSISPLSGTATAAWAADDDTETGAYGVLLRNLDQGLPGVVAILIYRTKSLVNVSVQGGALFYFVARIPVGSSDYLDIMPDSQLVFAAPELTDSIPIPTTLRYLESWDGKTWAAGGPGFELRLIYSGDGPEQYPAFNFFDVGLRKGGAITGIQGYLGVLLVFRERAIEVVTPDQAGLGYRITTLAPDVGTTATNTVTYVPGVGVFFLGYDGVRVIRGQGTNLQLDRESVKVAKELGRINTAALPRATAAWSEREREWWCHFPADGSPQPNRGIVYHRDIMAWSVRGAVSSSSPGAFQFNCLDTLPDGYFIFGCQVVNSSTIISAPVLWNMGLQVWSSKDREGLAVIGTQVDEAIFNVTSTTLGNPVTGRWASRWENFGSDMKLKSVRGVYVEAVTVGHNPLTLDYATDWTENYTSAGTQTASLSSIYQGPSEGPTYGLSLAGDNGALIASSRWTSEKVTRLRWDVATKAVAWFKWRISATSRFFVLRSRIAYVQRDRKTIKQGSR